MGYAPMKELQECSAGDAWSLMLTLWEFLLKVFPTSPDGMLEMLASITHTMSIYPYLFSQMKNVPPERFTSTEPRTSSNRRHLGSTS